MATLHAVFGRLRQLKASWPPRGWSYDDRFECVATSFEKEFALRARELLQPVFPETYSERTLPNASPALRGLAERTGGLRAAQLVLAAAPVAGLTPYVLWWPWEEAPTISIRVGLDGASPEELQTLCACFAIAP